MGNGATIGQFKFVFFSSIETTLKWYENNIYYVSRALVMAIFHSDRLNFKQKNKTFVAVSLKSQDFFNKWNLNLEMFL